jgi:hypothetical protein
MTCICFLNDVDFDTVKGHIMEVKKDMSVTWPVNRNIQGEV